jgi:hypothetical protein
MAREAALEFSRNTMSKPMHECIRELEDSILMILKARAEGLVE